MNPRIIHWDLKALSRALQLESWDVVSAFRDGRLCSFFMRGQVQNLFPKNVEFSTRIITKKGVAFSPPFMRGCGRQFNQGRFVEYLAGIDSFAAVDAYTFPRTTVWVIPAAQVRAWFEDGALGKRAEISRATFARLAVAARRKAA